MRYRVVILVIVACFLLPVRGGAQQKERPPEGGTPKEFKLPEKHVLTLDNGLRAVLVQYGEVPKVTVSAAVAAGNLYEGADEVWLADLTGDFLKEGTTNRSAEEIARAAARMGGTLAVNVGPDQVFVQGDVLSEHAPDFVRLVADVLQHPLFPASELERLKTDQLRTVSIQKSSPGPLAQERFMAALYGDHPYGRIFPSEQMIKSRTIDQVRKFYQRTFGAGRTTVYIVGRFDAQGIERTVREAFASWGKGEPVQRIPTHPRTERSIYIVDRPGAPQSTIYMGVPVMDPSKREYRALLVMNALLGGSFGSRITANIRENKGYTYSPSGFVSSRYRDAYWAEVADVSTEVTGASLREIFKEIDSLQAHPPGEDELKGIKNYLAGVFVLQNSTRGGIVGQLTFLDLHGLPDAYLRDAVKNIHAVTPDEVRKLAQTQIRDDEMTVVVVGDRKKIESQVAPFGKIVQ